jgi:glucokinase
MEIGHLVVMPGGPLCGCGKTGCLEAVAGRLAIASEAAVSAFRGSAPNLLRCCGTSLADIRSGDLANAINAGDETVAQIVRKAGRSVGLALANVVNLLAPDLLLLGGGLMEALAEILFPIIEAEIRARAMKGFTQDLRVERAVLGDQAIVLGAAALAAERVGPS